VQEVVTICRKAAINTLRHWSYESFHSKSFIEISCIVGVLGAVAVRLQAFRVFSIVVSCKGLRLCRAVFRLHIV